MSIPIWLEVAIAIAIWVVGEWFLLSIPKMPKSPASDGRPPNKQLGQMLEHLDQSWQSQAAPGWLHLLVILSGLAVAIHALARWIGPETMIGLLVIGVTATGFLIFGIREDGSNPYQPLSREWAEFNEHRYATPGWLYLFLLGIGIFLVLNGWLHFIRW